MSMEQPLLNSYLKQLCLSTFIHNHERFAVEAAHNQHSYSRYLLALAEQEVAQREARRRQRRIKEARLPVVKALSDFEFAAIPSLNAQKIWQLAQGDYIRQREPVLFVGNPGLGKTHLSLALAVAACRQDYRAQGTRLLQRSRPGQRTPPSPTGTASDPAVGDSAAPRPDCARRIGLHSLQPKRRPVDLPVLLGAL